MIISPVWCVCSAYHHTLINIQSIICENMNVNDYKPTPRALIIIVAIHALIAAVGSLYLLNRTPRFKELADPGLPPPQPSPARQTVGPAITIPAPPRPSSDSYLVSANVLRKPRRVASGNHVPCLDLPLRIAVWGKYHCSLGRYIPTLLPKTFARAPGAPPATIGLPDAPDALEFFTPVMSVPNRSIAASEKRARGWSNSNRISDAPRRTFHAATCWRGQRRAGEGS